MPGSLRFLLILGCLAGIAYGAVYTLATMRPEQSEVVKLVPNERLFR
ncbi:hypothetical protein FHS85_000044 [Rhodoligotrophos appendicifer]